MESFLNSILSIDLNIPSITTSRSNIEMRTSYLVANINLFVNHFPFVSLFVSCRIDRNIEEKKKGRNSRDIGEKRKQIRIWLFQVMKQEKKIFLFSIQNFIPFSIRSERIRPYREMLWSECVIVVENIILERFGSEREREKDPSTITLVNILSIFFLICQTKMFSPLDHLLWIFPFFF